jgi:crotonobetainyl-CoA:carnitine CoA-transferase CaiB-like acyl-CoA transferase
VSFSDAENAVRTAPPLLGEHTRAVLEAELGIDAQELERLRRAKAIDFRTDERQKET